MVRRKQNRPVAKRRGEGSENCVEDVSHGTNKTRQGLVDKIWSVAKKLEEGQYENGKLDSNAREERKRKRRKKTANGIDEFLLEIPSNVDRRPWFVGVVEGIIYQGSFDDAAKGLKQWYCSFSDEDGKECMCLRGGSSSILVQGPGARDLVGLLRSGYVTLRQLERVEDGDESIHAVMLFGVHVEEKGFRDLKSYPEDAKGKTGSRQLLQLLKWLRPEAVGANGNSEKTEEEKKSCDAEHLIVSWAEDSEDIELDASGLYGLIRPTGKEEAFTGTLKELKPTLHGYQKRALKWMIDRENIPESFKGCQHGTNHLLWRAVCCLSCDSSGCEREETKTFYVNEFNGTIRKEMPRIPEKPRGGIACDEMGLGKTVEVLSLIVANRMMENDLAGNQQCKPDGDDADKVLATTCGRNSTDNHGGRQHDDVMSCVCGRYDDEIIIANAEEGLIQCCTCKVWSHGNCVGVRLNGIQSQWKCFRCIKDEIACTEVIDAPTTLIVCPPSILSQWENEIQRHVVPGSLKVLKYMGQPQPPLTNVASATTPRDIAQADIVLTTYDVLRQDLYRNPDREAGRSLRYEKRYDIIPTPLTGVRFWRVVVDEAQMVESSTAKATEMAMKIQSINRWCVTGTPISRGLEDLYGLFAFLRVEPYSAKSWWNMLIQNPLETGENYESALNRLINLLKPSIGGLMWRSSKSDVADELNLPEQIIHPTRLDFSKIERHFYSRQYEKCAGTARQVLQKSGITSLKEVLDVHGHDGNVQTTDGKNSQDRLLTKREERKLLLPLLRLRQACVHPQVGIGGLKSLSQVKTPMSMIEVLQVLINKAKVEAEDAQRLLLSSLNGLAGLKIIQSNYPEAASFYRRVLQLSQENDAMIKADKLQILHAMSNLGEIILKPGVGRTLQDETLEKAIENTQRTYMYESLERLRLMNNELEHIKGEERECLLNFSNGKSDMSDLVSNWWIDALRLISDYTFENGKDVVHSLKQHLSEDDLYRQAASRNATNLATRFRDAFGLKLVIQQELDAQDSSRREVLDLLKNLGHRVDSQDKTLIETAAHCSACRSFNATGGIVCDHCSFDKKMIEWEVRIFTHVASSRGKANLTAEAVAAAAHRQALSKVGRGGLGESEHLQGAGVLRPKRSDNKVADSKITRGPSQAEKALKFISNALKNVKLPDGQLEPRRELILAASKAHLEILEFRRKEYIKVGAVATAQRQVLYALDELGMCRMRIQLRKPSEIISQEEERYMVYEYEIPSRISELEAESSIAEQEVKRTMGTLKYLKGLEKMNNKDSYTPHASDGVNTDDSFCPVCHDPLVDEMAMLPCGHLLCLQCNVAITEKESRGKQEKVIKCPSCRMASSACETAVVTKAASPTLPTQAESWAGESSIQVKGSFGTKIEAVVRRIKALLLSHPDDRIIVFSTWKDALDIVAHAFFTNGIEHLHPRNAKSFDAAIQAFRGDSNSAKVLLLLVKQGGNGLNLQQAQHVIFVEPILDPGEEAQAIGRIDRMGQSKSTFVHKFLIRSSVEENVERISDHKRLYESGKKRHSKSHHLSVSEVTALLQ